MPPIEQLEEDGTADKADLVSSPLTAESLSTTGPYWCEHRYWTSYGKGWECTRCGMGFLSIAVPLPMPLVEEALKVIVSVQPPKDSPASSSDEPK